MTFRLNYEIHVILHGLRPTVSSLYIILSAGVNYPRMRSFRKRIIRFDADAVAISEKRKLSRIRSKQSHRAFISDFHSHI